MQPAPKPKICLGPKSVAPAEDCTLIFATGRGALVPGFVPGFENLTGLPPYLGMLCGLACAFCAYLFITRCRSQGPKMGRARTMYSDSEVSGARGAQGDVPASEL